jgi:hypothetical protein
MKTIIAIVALAVGLGFTSAQARDSISTERTQDLSHWHHHHHHHHHWWHRHYYPY